MDENERKVLQALVTEDARIETAPTCSATIHAYVAHPTRGRLRIPYALVADLREAGLIEQREADGTTAFDWYVASPRGRAAADE